jgi:outer membrane protein TolC
MSTTNQSKQNSKKILKTTTENISLDEALKEDQKEVEFLKKSIVNLTEQLIATRNQLRELTGEKPSDSKSSRASEFYKNNPGLTRKEYIAAFLELGFGKAYAATIYQKIKKMNTEVLV